MKTVEDLMTPSPKMVYSSQPLAEVVRLFLEKGISSTPVKNSVGEVIGMLTEVGLQKAFMLHKAKFEKKNLVAHHTDLLEPLSFIDRKASLSDLLKEMLASPTHRLLVRDEQLKIVGIVSPKDLLRVMLGEPVVNDNLKEKLKETEHELSELVQKSQSLELQLDTYRNFFHSTPYMMHAVDENGKILMANKKECLVLGYQEDELVGKTIFELYTKAMHAEALQGLEKIKKTGQHHMTYTSLLRKDGSSIRCDIASSAIRDRDGKFLSTLSVLRPLDSEQLLRELNGVVDEQDGPLSKYSRITDTE